MAGGSEVDVLEQLQVCATQLNTLDVHSRVEGSAGLLPLYVSRATRRIASIVLDAIADHSIGAPADGLRAAACEAAGELLEVMTCDQLYVDRWDTLRWDLLTVCGLLRDAGGC